MTRGAVVPVVCAVLLTSGCVTTRPPPRTLSTVVPDGFVVVAEADAVTLYRNAEGSIYVQVANLADGAEATVVAGTQGTIGDDCSCPVTTTGTNPGFERLSPPDAWTAAAANDPSAFCLVNGSFFCNSSSSCDPCDPSSYQYALRSAGIDLSVGDGPYGDIDYPTASLSLWDNHAAIAAYDGDGTLCDDGDTCAPAVVVANASCAPGQQCADRNPDEAVGRTYAGTRDDDGDGLDEILLVLSAAALTAEQAASTLESFGAAAEDIVMLDGGGSTQMQCVDGYALPSSDSGGVRTVPMLLLVSAAR